MLFYLFNSFYINLLYQPFFLLFIWGPSTSNCHPLTSSAVNE